MSRLTLKDGTIRWGSRWTSWEGAIGGEGMTINWDINAGNLLTIIIMVAGFIITYTKLIARIAKWETKLDIMWTAFSRRWTGNHDHDKNIFDSQVNSFHQTSTMTPAETHISEPTPVSRHTPAAM